MSGPNSQTILRNPNELYPGVPRPAVPSEPAQDSSGGTPPAVQEVIFTEPLGIKRMERPIKLVIGMPMRQEVEFRWFINFIGFLKQAPQGINTDIIVGAQYGVAESRQKVVDTFLGMPDATHLLWLDTDILPVDWSIPTLIKDNLPVVSGIYSNSLYTGFAAWQDEQALNFNNIVAQNRDNPLIQVDKIGLGLCLIKKEVFQAMSTIDKPWFYYKVTDGGSSEDFYFCHLLRRLGIKPVVDLRVQASHMKYATVGPNMQVNL